MTQSQTPNPKSRLTLPDLLFAVLFVAACLVRLWQITRIPHTLWIDEAGFASRGRDVVKGVNYLPFTPPGLGVGESAMQVYLAAAVQILGLSVPYSSRIASALVGAVTIGMLYLILAATWRREYGASAARWLALIASLVLAGLFAHLYASRMGTQNALSVAVTIPTLWLFWEALQSPRLTWAALAGVSLGLSQYAYEASRAFPLLVGVLWLVHVIQTAPEDRKRAIAQLGVTIACAVLVFLPAALVYARHPETYFGHMRDASRAVLSGSPPEVLAKVLENYARAVAGISLRGDLLLGRNLVGRPLLGPFLSVFCWLGGIVALRRVRSSRPSQLFLLWLGIMLLPSALADEAPAFTRMLPVIPALAALVPVGMLWTWRRVGDLAGDKRRLAQRAVGVFLAIGLIFSWFKSHYDYFVRWANDPHLFVALGAGTRLLADRALELANTDQVYLTPDAEQFQIVYEVMLDGSPIKVVNGTVCLPLVDRPTCPVDYGIVTIADHQSLPSLKSLYPGGHEIDYVVHPDGYAFAVVFQIPAGTPGPVPQYPAATEFAAGPTLIGYDLSTSSARPGETVGLVLYWQATAAQAEILVSFIHIGKGRHSDPLVANHDAQICGTAYPTSRWSEGEIILDRHTLTVVDDAPADTYEITAGVYRASDRLRLEIVESAHFAQDNRVTIGTLTVAP
jgi:hypothetical protein